MKIYKFGCFYLNTFERKVLKNGKFLELTTKTFDVLQLLVENCGAIVTKDELLGKVWNGNFVEEGNLAVHISKLRRLFDETKERQLIETVQGIGYRFIAPVQTINQNEWENAFSVSSSPEKLSVARNFDSIAVLPLENESDNPEIEYLADGLTESIINNLARHSNLKVVSRNTVFSYKNKNSGAKEIGEKLGVSLVLTGRIRSFKENLIISVELTNTADDAQIWGKRFNQPFSDIIEIENGITKAVAEKIKSATANENLLSSNIITQNPESYRLYLKGKYFLDKHSKPDLYNAIDCFQKSVALDALNVHSYAEIVLCFFILYIYDYISYQDFLRNTDPIFLIFSETNQSVDIVQAVYGLKMFLAWKNDAAEKHFRQALRLNPNCIFARHCYLALLTKTGRNSAALEELSQLIRIDPLSLTTYQAAAKALYRMGQFENAMIYLNDALELDAENYETLAVLGAVSAELGSYDKSLFYLEKSLKLHFNIEVFSMLGYVYALINKNQKAFRIIEQLQTDFPNKHAIKIARIYSVLNEKEKAFDFLEIAFQQHDIDLISLNADPRWSKIKDEPRFKELAQRIGL